MSIQVMAVLKRTKRYKISTRCCQAPCIIFGSTEVLLSNYYCFESHNCMLFFIRILSREILFTFVNGLADYRDIVKGSKDVTYSSHLQNSNIANQKKKSFKFMQVLICFGLINLHHFICVQKTTYLLLL